MDRINTIYFTYDDSCAIIMIVIKISIDTEDK